MATQNKTGRNRVLVPEARKGLEQFKLEVANELGITNYDNQDKGNPVSYTHLHQILVFFLLIYSEPYPQDNDCLLYTSRCV